MKPTLTILTAVLVALPAALPAAEFNVALKPAEDQAGTSPDLPVPDGLGINIHYFSGLTTNDLDLTRDAGFRFIRAYPAKERSQDTGKNRRRAGALL